MKQTKKRALALSAFTLIEMFVVIIVIAVLISMILPTLPRKRVSYYPGICANNLKEIGTAYRLWANDNGDLVPSQQSVSKGGWKDLLTNADQGKICWTNYAIMQNELGQSPKIVVCPSDERSYAMDFTNKFDNFNLSYFVGVSANDIYPQSIQGGDRNLGPGLKPDPDYGFSAKYGMGDDIAIPVSGPVSWSLKMHSPYATGSPSGAGNILLGDGSTQQCSNADFNQNWLRNAPPTTNWPAGHIPATSSIRLVFP